MDDRSPRSAAPAPPSPRDKLLTILIRDDRDEIAAQHGEQPLDRMAPAAGR